MVKKNSKEKQTPQHSPAEGAGETTPRKSGKNFKFFVLNLIIQCRSHQNQEHQQLTHQEEDQEVFRRVRRLCSEWGFEVANREQKNKKKTQCIKRRQQQFNGRVSNKQLSWIQNRRQENNPQKDQQEQEYRIPTYTEEGIPLSYYTGRTSYRLDSFNSITVQQGQIFNLLEDPFLKERHKKDIRCNCSQSRCRAKYCVCYSKGRRCGIDCGCINCANLVEPIRQENEENVKSCKCQKSHCLKNYCECRRDGEFCSPSCRCKSCRNVKPIEKQKYYGQERRGDNTKRRLL